MRAAPRHLTFWRVVLRFQSNNKDEMLAMANTHGELQQMHGLVLFRKESSVADPCEDVC